MTSKRRAILGCVAALALLLTGTSPAEGRADRHHRDPVTVGVILQTDGGIVTPEFGEAVDAMVAYFNAELGGVSGRRMVTEVCTTDETPASAAACAQRFASDDDVHLVIESTTSPLAIADVLVPAGKALLAGGVDPRIYPRTGVFVMEAGHPGAADALFTYGATDVGISHLTVFYTNDPALAAFRPLVDFVTARAGIVVDAYVPIEYDDTDVTATIAGGLHPSSDGIAMIIVPPHCTPATQALQTLEIDLPVLAAELCLLDDIVSSGVTDGWYVGQQSLLPVADGGWEAARYRRILDRYGDGDAETGGFAGIGVGYTWIARDVLRRAGGGRATDASVLRVLSTYSSDDVPGYAEVSCPGPEPFAPACYTTTLMIQARQGELRDVGWYDTDFTIFKDLLRPR